MTDWRNEYRGYVRDGMAEARWTFGQVFGPIVLLIVVLTVSGYALGWCSETARVVQDELGPRALLKKYSWFKDASAALDKKRADIAVYEQRLTALKAAYEGTPRKDWPRDDRSQLAIWESEAAGVKASYNALAAEYNAAMVKIQWAFTNVGDLPAGATVPLPREYKPYINE